MMPGAPTVGLRARAKEEAIIESRMEACILFTKNRSIVLQKRKTLRMQITNLIPEAGEKMDDGEGKDSLSIIISQIGSITEILRAADARMESFLPDKTAADEFDRAVAYERKNITAISKIKLSIN
ncbi:hypothetical protein MRX96_020028 [Rhipicephalus microplus]